MHLFKKNKKETPNFNNSSTEDYEEISEKKTC